MLNLKFCIRMAFLLSLSSAGLLNAKDVLDDSKVTHGSGSFSLKAPLYAAGGGLGVSTFAASSPIHGGASVSSKEPTNSGGGSYSAYRDFINFAPGQTVTKTITYCKYYDRRGSLVGKEQKPIGGSCPAYIYYYDYYGYQYKSYSKKEVNENIQSYDYNMALKFGGSGFYVNGDYAMTGKSILKSTRGKGYSGNLYSDDVTDLAENSSGFSINSSMQDISLPDDVTSDDIVFVGLYWQGHLVEVTGGNLTEREINELNKGYQDVKIKFGSSQIPVSIHRDYCGGELSYNYGSRPGSRMFYGCGADITRQFKQYAKDKHDFKNKAERYFTVGDIKTSIGTDPKNSAYYKGEVKSSTFRMGLYGGWSVIVVYDKNNAAQQKLITDYGATQAKKIIDAYYKPKSVSIYEGYAMLKGSKTDKLNIDISGFYTPKTGTINAKMGFFGAAGELGMNAGEHFKAQDKKNSGGALKDLNNGSDVDSTGSINIFDGSERILVPKSDGTYKQATINTGFTYYNLGIDVDEFDLSNFMVNKQTDIKLELSADEITRGGSTLADQNYISYIAFSTDIYVPKLCYEDEIYDTSGWLNYFDMNTGNRKKPTTKPAEISGAVISGENLYYRVKIKNQVGTDGSGEDASNIRLNVGMGKYNQYVTESSSIDNTMTQNKLDDADYSFIKDNKVGAWKDMKFTTPDTRYNNKQSNSYTSGDLSYYIGRNAGIVSGSAVNGGELKMGESAFVEFNATVGKTYKYHEIQYTADYEFKPAGATTPIKLGGIALERCEDKKRDLRITTLKGLQVVNQNFKEKDEKQDDRLYTQIADKEFNANLIFRPDFSSLYEEFCTQWENPSGPDKGKCLKYNIPDDADDIFDKATGTMNTNKLDKFVLPGKLYLSLIRSGDVGACSRLTDKDKLPFRLDGGRYRKDYDLEKFKNKKVMQLKDLVVEDGFRGVTFMLSYYPTGLESKNSAADGSTSSSITAGAGSSDLSGMSEEDRKKLEDEIKDLEKLFGVKQSSDGAFHLCSSDSFAVRPAYFQADINSATKYAKMVDPNKSGDITTAEAIQHAQNLRVGGDYAENADVASKMFYALGYDGNGVPNYNPIIGGDRTLSIFSIKPGYGSTPDSDADTTTDLNNQVSLNKTFLEPFISQSCRSGIEHQSYSVQRGVSGTLTPISHNKGDSDGGKISYKGYNGNSVTSISGSDDGKNTSTFDKNNYRIWDIDGISLFANFGLKDIKGDTSAAGAFKEEEWSKSDLRDEALKTPSNKAKKPALLYTGALDNSYRSKFFNYYNVGDVKVNLYDNTWTINDQLISKEWGSAGCIVGSSSNIADTKGMIGCDVSMKDNKALVLRYQPDRIEVSLTGIGNSPLNDKTSEANMHYTYYDSPEYLPQNLELSGFSQTLLKGNDAKYNKALLNNINNQNLAQIRFGAVAYLSNKVYKDVIATMFDGVVEKGQFNSQEQEAPRCGFSTDVDMDLSFNFDCSNAAYASDPRCTTNNSIVKALSAAKTFNPFPDLAGYSINIPSGTAYIAQEDCTRAESRFDSRCYKFDARRLPTPTATIDQTMQSIIGDDEDRVLPLTLAINYYSDGSRDGNVINRVDNASPSGDNQLMFNPKLARYTLLKKGFNQGKSENITAYFNFERSQKHPNKPLIILGEDFSVTNTNVVQSMGVPSFDKDGELLNSSDAVLFTSTGGNFSGEPKIAQDNFTTTINTGNIQFNDFITNRANEEGVTPDQLKTNEAMYAYFVYGDVNYHGTNGTAVGPMAGFDVPITSYVYCGMNDGCKNIPYTYIAGNTLFERLNSSSSDYWINNRFDVYSAAEIESEFVRRYRALAPEVTFNRAGFTTATGENVNFQSTRAGITSEVRVFTKPWFIYTPNDDTMLMDRDGANNIYYNYFNVSFKNQGEWGGEGEVKGATKAGDVGKFVGDKDHQANENSNLKQNSRLDW